MKKVGNIIALLSCLLGYSQQNAYSQQYAKYTMDIDVDAKKYSYQGKQKIEYHNNSEDTLKVIYLHLYWNVFQPNSTMDQRVQSQGKNADGRLVEKKGEQVVSRLASIPKDECGQQNIHWIKQNGKKVKTELQETILKVTLDNAMLPKTKTTLEMEWDAVIPKQIRRSGRNNREGIEMTMTQWYPKIAEYDVDGWATFDYVGREFHAPFSDFDVNIKIDKNYVIGAGGILQNPNEVKGYNNTKVTTNQPEKNVWKWKAKQILDFAWAADPDYSVEKLKINKDLDVFLVCQKGEKTKNWELAKPYIKSYFEIMNQRFGNYIYPSYSFVQGGDGGMEYGMCTMILGNATSVEGLCGLMFHEGAHSWYQQMLATNESMRPWMDEGFTSYAESTVMYQLFPPKTPLSNPYENTINAYRKFVKSGKEEPAVWLGDHHDNGTAYTYATYIKGELYLVQLAYIMGEKNLAKVLKQYYQQWHLKHPTDKDFLHIAQKVSEMDLKWFHHYWINTTKTINYAINSAESNGKNTKIFLENKGQIPMPLDIRITFKDNTSKNYQLPINLTRVYKTQDQSWEKINLQPWNWTTNQYVLELPIDKSTIQRIEIDPSKRLADVELENNVLEL